MKHAKELMNIGSIISIVNATIVWTLLFANIKVPAILQMMWLGTAIVVYIRGAVMYRQYKRLSETQLCQTQVLHVRNVG